MQRRNFNLQGCIKGERFGQIVSRCRQWYLLCSGTIRPGTERQYHTKLLLGLSLYEKWWLPPLYQSQVTLLSHLTFAFPRVSRVMRVMHQEVFVSGSWTRYSAQHPKWGIGHSAAIISDPPFFGSGDRGLPFWGWILWALFLLRY